MKDYPEAQDILQTLGRKRLMEVRCVNKKHAKNVAERDSIAGNDFYRPLNDIRTRQITGFCKIPCVTKRQIKRHWEALITCKSKKIT